jgi:ubiquitin-protein ligase
VLLGLLTILQDPNPLDPLNHEASRLLRDEPEQFARNVMLSLMGALRCSRQAWLSAIQSHVCCAV